MILSPRDVAEAYNRWYEGLSDGQQGSWSPWHAQIQRHPVFADLKDKRVLEIGCGRGEFSLWLTERDPTVLVGADLSGVATARAKARSADRATFMVSDIQQMPFPEDPFDVVGSWETEHVPDPQLAVRELARVLRLGGTLVLTTPNYLSTVRFYRLYLRLRGRRFTEVGQAINQLRSIPRSFFWLPRTGISPSHITSVGHYVPWPGRRPIRLLHLDRPSPPWRWIGHHSVFLGRKPRRRA